MSDTVRISSFIISDRKMSSDKYDKYRADELIRFEKFKSSINKELEFEPQPYRIRFESIISCMKYRSILMGGKSIVNNGSAVFATAQALYGNKVTFEQVKEIAEVIEKKGYYYPERGVWWHWFDNFCIRAETWQEVIDAVSKKKKVVMLLNPSFLKTDRNHFVTIVGILPAKRRLVVTGYDELVYIPIENINNMIVASPWIFNS